MKLLILVRKIGALIKDYHFAHFIISVMNSPNFHSSILVALIEVGWVTMVEVGEMTMVVLRCYATEGKQNEYK